MDQIQYYNIIMNTCYLKVKKEWNAAGSTLLWNVFIRIVIWNKAISKNLINPRDLNKGLE